MISGSCPSVSGEMPCSWVPVVLENRRPAHDLDPLGLCPEGQLDIKTLNRAQRHIDAGQHDLTKAVFRRGHFVAGRRQVAERVFAVRTTDRRRDDLVLADIPERERGIGNDRVRAVPHDAGNRPVEALGCGKRGKQNERRD